MDSEDKSTLYRLVTAADKIVNTIALILFLILLLYAGHAIWYTHSLQNGSFLPDELAEYRPDGESPTLSDLIKQNPDVISWLTIDDTHIDYPVVQGQDDIEYLNKDVLGNFSLAGSIFMTTQNSKDFTDSYTVIYGHHIEGGAMFADILNFKEASFFETHKTGTLWHPNGRPDSADRIDIFALVEVGADDRVIYCDPSSINGENLPELVDYVNEIATQKRPVVIEEDTRIVAMSTCENATSFERVILFGKLRPMTEAEILAAMDKEKEGALSTKQEGERMMLSGTPMRVLEIIAILLLLILIYLLWRIHKRRRERREQREAERYNID